MCRLCRGLIYHALVVLAGLLMIGGSCSYDGDRDVPSPRPANADYTRIVNPSGAYSGFVFDYPKYEYRGTPTMPQHVNLVFVEIPSHTEEINSWFSQFIDGSFVSGNEVQAIKSDSRFSNNWSYVDVYGRPRSIPVNTFTINANVPTDASGNRWDLARDIDGRYFFRTGAEAFRYYIGDHVNKGSVLTDIQIDEPLNSRFFHSWTNFVFLSPAYIRDDNSLGLARFIAVGRRGDFNEYVSVGVSIIFLGKIRESVEDGYRTYTNPSIPLEVINAYGRGSFDEVAPLSNAFIRNAQLVTYHEAIHVFQQKIYLKDLYDINAVGVSHCNTINCLMTPFSGLEISVRYTIPNVSSTSYYITNYSTSDFNRITLKSDVACWVHRLSGNVLSWITRDGYLSMWPNERR